MANMQELMQKNIQIGALVTITLKNGKEVLGTIDSFDEDLFCIQFPNGHIQPISYELVGTYDLMETAAMPAVKRDSEPTPESIYEEIRDSAVDIILLQREFNREQREVYQSCSAAIESLKNAIKISETSPNFNRTPRIIAKVQGVSQKNPGNRYLLALLGETALLTKDSDVILEVLSYFMRDWTDSCCKAYNLLRLLDDLSLRCNDFSVIKQINAQCPEKLRPDMAKAIVYVLRELKMEMPVQAPARIESPEVYQALTERLNQLPGAAIKPAAEPVQAQPELKPELNQTEGRIVSYNPETGFGFVRDRQGKDYQFIDQNVAEDNQQPLKAGMEVRFTKGLVYSVKHRKQVDCAKDIVLIGQSLNLQYGYIILFMAPRGYGYIVQEKEYKEKKRGDIYFEIADVSGGETLNTRQNDYRVSFQYSAGPRKRAVNIQILEAVPKYDADFTEIAQGKPVDFGRFDFVQGETLVIKKKRGERCVGQYTGKTESAISLRGVGGIEEAVSFDEIDTLFFCGLITSYNVFNSSGLINNSFAFRITNVINRQLIHLLKMGKQVVCPCLYSLIIDGTTSYISVIDYFTKETCEQLVWQPGKIWGLYKSDVYFSVDQECRCYTSTITDNTITKYLQDKDFLGQEVFYKAVYHRTVDERRRTALSVSAIDIRSKYQIGKLIHSSEHRHQGVQCGSHIYPCSLELNQYKDGTEVRIELACRDQTGLMAGSLDFKTLSLPSFVKANQQEKAVFDAKVRQAGLDEDYELQISLTEEMLERQFLNPERAMGAIFKICVTHGQLARAIQAITQYSYLLAPDFFEGLMMQADALTGNAESAAKHAHDYLAVSGGADEFLTSIAGAILQQAFPPEVLRRHIIDHEPLRNIGEIAYYDASTKSGYIKWWGRKLNFSHKDLVDYDSSRLDLDRFTYYASFDIDRSKTVPKASNVRISKTERKSAAAVETAQRNDTVNTEAVPDFLDDEILDIPAMTTLLEFKRDNFNLSGTIGYLPREERQRFKGSAFAGTAEEAKKLIESLQKCYKDKGKDRPKFFLDTPPEIRPNLLLAAAKIHREFIDEEGNDDFFCEKTGNSILFEYAIRFLSGNNATEPAEVEYYCESIFLNDFSEALKFRMQARCIAAYFEKTAGIDLNGCGEKGAIVGILRRRCTDVPALSKMLLNMPREVLKDILDCAAPALLEDIARVIIVQLNSGMLNKGENRKEAIQRYYNNYHKSLDELIRALTRSTRFSIDNVQFFLDQMESALESIGKHLFDLDESLFRRACRTLGEIRTSLQTEEVDSRTDRLQLAWQEIRTIIQSIEEHPSKLSFESLRPFLLQLNESISEYLDGQCVDCQPKLTVRHYSLRNGGRQEIIEVSNAGRCLPAVNVRVTAALSGSTAGFMVDTGGSRNIAGNGQQIRGGKAAEFKIPINLDQDTAPDVVELDLSVSYDFKVRYDRQQGIMETKTAKMAGQKVQIPVKIRETDFIYENPYAAFAGGKVMKPDEPDAEKMFFGRDKDIRDICQMLEGADRKLNAGSILAIYGQKRCGKSSVMFFLGKWIEDHYPNTIVVDINLQAVGTGENKETFYKNILANICTRFRLKIRRLKQLEKEIAEAGLTIPSTRELVSEYGEGFYQNFFQTFREYFGQRYTIFLMVDEFTQIYVHMKQHRISEDFLNRWRAMVQENGFVNVVVGQDFMDKLTTDEDITSQNLGGAVNGLGTMGRKRLSYLGEDEARRMIEEPVCFSDGKSRYQGPLGQEAISCIYDLTGGSAFYLMKFCSALVEYMIANQEQLVSRGLVETVASGYVFDAPNNPITKADFDPIFNEYSYRDVTECAENKDGEFDITAQVRDEAKKTYSILKKIADAADSQGVCSVRRITWPDNAERNRLLRSLMVRGVLTDQNGRDITAEQIDELKIKIKVRLFSIWLKERG